MCKEFIISNLGIRDVDCRHIFQQFSIKSVITTVR